MTAVPPGEWLVQPGWKASFLRFCRTGRWPPFPTSSGYFTTGGIEDPQYIIELTEASVKEIGSSEDPFAKISELYQQGEITIQPQTFGSKLKFGLVNKLMKWFS